MSDTSTRELWPLDEMLADMRREFPNQHTLPRNWAAGVLRAVGEHIAWGSRNSGYSARELGWALRRVFSSDPEALNELTQGYQEAAQYYTDGTIPDDVASEITGE